MEVLSLANDPRTYYLGLCRITVPRIDLRMLLLTMSLILSRQR